MVWVLRQPDKLNIAIPSEEWEKAESLFEDFGVSVSGLRGWLTSQPEKVQKLLGLKPTEGKRGNEDDIKQFEDAITALENVK